MTELPRSLGSCGDIGAADGGNDRNPAPTERSTDTQHLLGAIDTSSTTERFLIELERGDHSGRSIENSIEFVPR